MRLRAQRAFLARLASDRGRQGLESAIARAKNYGSRASSDRAPLPGRLSEKDAPASAASVLGAHLASDRGRQGLESASARAKNYGSRASSDRAPLPGRLSEKDAPASA